MASHLIYSSFRSAVARCMIRAVACGQKRSSCLASFLSGVVRRKGQSKLTNSSSFNGAPSGVDPLSGPPARCDAGVLLGRAGVAKHREPPHPLGHDLCARRLAARVYEGGAEGALAGELQALVAQAGREARARGELARSPDVNRDRRQDATRCDSPSLCALHHCESSPMHRPQTTSSARKLRDRLSASPSSSSPELILTRSSTPLVIMAAPRPHTECSTTRGAAVQRSSLAACRWLEAISAPALRHQYVLHFPDSGSSINIGLVAALLQPAAVPGGHCYALAVCKNDRSRNSPFRASGWRQSSHLV